MLQTVLYQSMDSFVDWTKGKCSFDSDGFKALLEFCAGFPGSDELQQDQEDGGYESDSSRMLNKKQMLAQITLYDMGWTYQEYKAAFGGKAKMLTAEEAVERTGHAVGGVCPFAVKEGTEVYLDESLRRFDTVLPAAGSSNSCIELTLPELETYAETTRWVDVCKPREG